jgi:hypothetical protein
MTCPYARFCLCTRNKKVHTLAFNLVFVSSSARVIGCPRSGLALLRARTLFTIQGSSTTLVPFSREEALLPFTRAIKELLLHAQFCQAPAFMLD